MADRFGYGEIGLDIHPCKGCEDYEPPDGCKTRGGCAKSMTNADRLRAMSDEDLAEFFTDKFMMSLPIEAQSDEKIRKEGYTASLDWLKSPVEEVN